MCIQRPSATFTLCTTTMSLVYKRTKVNRKSSQHKTTETYTDGMNEKKGKTKKKRKIFTRAHQTQPKKRETHKHTENFESKALRNEGKTMAHGKVEQNKA